MKRLRLIALVMCAAGAVGCATDTPEQSRPATALGATLSVSKGRRGLRVLVFNIHAGRDSAGADNVAAVAALIRSTAADVVLLQEVDRRTRRSGGVDQPAALEARTGLRVTFGRTLDYDGGEYGIATLFRWRIASARVTPLPVSPPQPRAGGSTEPRGALVVAGRTSIGSLQMLNTHLDASREDVFRLQEADHLLSLISPLGARGPVVAGGDFNSTPESDVQQRLRAGGLRDAWRECGRGDGFTYPAAAPAKRIDYLFLIGRVRCASAAVVDSTVSDHRPLLVVIVAG